MRRPPQGVAFVARTHWLVGTTIAVSVALLFSYTRKLPILEFGPKTYAISIGLGVLYLLAGTLVWLGVPAGRVLSRVCGLLYLARPSFGSYLWDTMSTPEFQAHFTRRPPVPREEI